MKLESLRIENFRACNDIIVNFDDYTCFVGPNGAGKSTILTALNIFFRNTSSASTDLITLREEDFHNKNTNKDIKITATFGNLSDSAKEDFKAYYRSEKLIISARASWNPETNSAEVRQYGSRLVMNDFTTYFEADKKGEKVNILRDTYQELILKYPELPAAKSKGDMYQSLRHYEENHPDLCGLEESEDQFYGFARGSDRLAKYLQWVYIPAVKDAAEEQLEVRNTALGSLLQRSIRTKIDFKTQLEELKREVSEKYSKITQGQEKLLNEVSKTLTKRLKDWAHPNVEVKLKWNDENNKNISINEPIAKALVGEKDFLGEITRMGHGMQRAFIVTILHELALQDQEEEPTLLLGFEEPELYQHPPQARHLARILKELSSENVQVILTTHSPYFVSGKNFENVRIIRRKGGGGESKISHVTHEQLSKKIAEALGTDPQAPTSFMASIEQILQPSQNELFFCSTPILVEGLEDVAYISSYIELMGKFNDFRKMGGHFVICDGKTNLSRPLAIVKEIDLPFFVVFDGDSDCKPDEQDKHLRDNRCILKLCSILEDIDSLPKETRWHDNVVMWKTTIGKIVQEEIGQKHWERAEASAREEYGYHAGVKRKNSLLIAATLPEFNLEVQRREQLLRLVF